MSAADVTAKFRSAGMIVDGWVIPEDPSTTFAAGRQNAVDVLVGSNKDEAFFPGARTVQQFQEQARARWGALADQYLALYPHATDEEAQASAAQTSNDGTFWVSRLYADYQVQRGNKAYLYFFAQNPPAPAGQPAFPAAHAAEVPYVFNNVGELPLFPDRSDPKLAGASAPDLKVADQMSSYWVNFARTGNPNGPGLPVWQEHQVGASERADHSRRGSELGAVADEAAARAVRQAVRADAPRADVERYVSSAHDRRKRPVRLYGSLPASSSAIATLPSNFSVVGSSCVFAPSSPSSSRKCCSAAVCAKPFCVCGSVPGIAVLRSQRGAASCEGSVGGARRVPGRRSARESRSSARAPFVGAVPLVAGRAMLGLRAAPRRHWQPASSRRERA